jgi:hypothetical protein
MEAAGFTEWASMQEPGDFTATNDYDSAIG